ncbi:hypothetical protein C4J81_11300 [Deltaproteobacteria bacterium Smac51]|nr:hypothetical protein C4J81_11300 [Deltaproteobacteria bacterium Smac51]
MKLIYSFQEMRVLFYPTFAPLKSVAVGGRPISVGPMSFHPNFAPGRMVGAAGNEIFVPGRKAARRLLRP